MTVIALLAFAMRQSRGIVLTGSSAWKLKRAGVDLLGGRALKMKMHPFMACEPGDAFNLDDALTTGLVPVVGKYANRQRQLSAYLQLYMTVVSIIFVPFIFS